MNALNDCVKGYLSDILKGNGSGVIIDRRRFTALLADHCLGGYRAERHILCQLLDSGIVKEILESTDHQLREQDCYQYIRRLYNDYRIPQEDAAWALIAWGEALGKKTGILIAPPHKEGSFKERVETCTIIRVFMMSIVKFFVSTAEDRVLAISSDGKLGCINVEKGVFTVRKITDIMSGFGTFRDVFADDFLETILAINGDGRTAIFDTYTGGLLQTLIPGQYKINTVVFLKNTPFIITGNIDGYIYIWDRVSGYCISSMEMHNYPIVGIVCSPDGKFFASCDSSGRAKLFNLDKLKIINIRVIPVKVSSIINISEDGSQILYKDDNGCVILLSSKNLKQIGNQVLKVNSSEQLIASQNSKFMAVMDEHGVIKVVNADNGKSQTFVARSSIKRSSMEFIQSGRLLLAGRNDGCLELHDIKI